MLVFNWLLNSQLQTEATNGLLPITRAGFRILFSLKEMKVYIVPFLFGPLSLRIAQNIGCFLWPKRSIRGTREALFTGSYIHPLFNIH